MFKRNPSKTYTRLNAPEEATVADETRLQDAVQNGDRLTQLKVLRTMLAERFDDASPRDTAAIARQFQVTCDQIAELEGEAKTHDKFDPLKATKAQWADRLASAADLRSPNLCRQSVP